MLTLSLRENIYNQINVLSCLMHLRSHVNVIEFLRLCHFLAESEHFSMGFLLFLHQDVLSLKRAEVCHKFIEKIHQFPLTAKVLHAKYSMKNLGFRYNRCVVKIRPKSVCFLKCESSNKLNFQSFVTNRSNCACVANIQGSRDVIISINKQMKIFFKKRGLSNPYWVSN